MPDVLFSCHTCQQHLVVDAKGAGLTIACPGCGGQVKVPAKGDTGLIRVPEGEVLRDRVNELEAGLSVERRRAIKAEASLKSLTNRWEAAEETARRTAVETQKTVVGLQDSLAKCTHEIALVRDRADALTVERDRLHSSLNQATGELGLSRGEAESFQHQVQSLKTSLEQRDSALREAEVRWEAQVSASERQQGDAVRALEAIGAEQEKTARERDNLQKKLEKLGALAEDMRKRQEALGKALAREEEKSSAREQECGELQEALVGAQARVSRFQELEAALAEALAHAATSEEKAGLLQQEIKRWQEGYAVAQGDLSERTGQLAESELQWRTSESAREELSLAAVARDRHETTLHQQIVDLGADRDRLTAELAEAREALQRTESQLYHAMSAREGLSVMVGNLRRSLGETSELYDTMATTVDTLEREVQRLEAELRRLDRRAAA